jgi:hypothetical protein
VTNLPTPMSPFDQIRHEDEQGEYWTARELQEKLGYAASWQNFERVIHEARVACASQGYPVDKLFNAIVKKSSGGRPPRDFRLTRFACYMVALSADGTKEHVAAAKTYFAVKTRQQEEDELEIFDDPEAALEEWKERAIRSFMAHGYSIAYATNRVDSILSRKAIRNKWVEIGVTEEEIGILTDQMHMGTFGLSIDAHRELKGFPEVREGRIVKHKGNLRPAMTPMELAVITFAENVTLAIHEERDSHGYMEAARDVDDGSAIAKDKRLEIERITGKPVVSSRNMLKSPDGGIFGDLGEPDDPTKEGC